MSSAPKVLVLRAPGINCERETAHAFELAGGQANFVHVRRLTHEPALLEQSSILVIPGGFSYGDDIAAGRLLGLEMERRLGDEILSFVERGGLVLGICNGFQVLVRLGLLPRTRADEGLKEELSLTWNLSDHYECRWTSLRVPKTRCVFLEEGTRFHWPAAHAEGRLVTESAKATATLVDEGFVAVRYVDDAGEPTASYPSNPNGSPEAIAGLTDASGQVLGVMPHPDRAYLKLQLPRRLQDAKLDPRPEAATLDVFAAMVRAAKS